MRHWKHWGLAESPFRGGMAGASPARTAAYFHRGAAQDEALARLQFLVEDGRRLGFVSGATGSGKSCILGELAGELRQAGRRVVELSLLGLAPREMLTTIANQLGTAHTTSDITDLWRAIGDRLKELRYQQIGAVLLGDDAAEGTFETATCLARLAQLGGSAVGSWTIVLATADDGTAGLSPRLSELCELRIAVEAWDGRDTAAFVSGALAAGGAGNAFEPDALLRIHELSGGLPRRAAQLAEMALVAGAAAGLRRIDEYTIDGVFQEFAAPIRAAEFAR